ncbi:MAG: hypothetical protein IPF52_14360 [Saprospiraceae bacterium]|nr:hypothetical protein [Saprospiraceae bacterium]
MSYTNGGTATRLTTGETLPDRKWYGQCAAVRKPECEFTDQCNNAITHTQNITVTPIAPPAFVNPPTSAHFIARHELATLTPENTLSHIPM